MHQLPQHWVLQKENKRCITCWWVRRAEPRSDSILWEWVVCDSVLRRPWWYRGRTRSTSPDTHLHTLPHVCAHVHARIFGFNRRGMSVSPLHRLTDRHTHTHTQTQTHIHTRPHTHTHTHTYTYMHTYTKSIGLGITLNPVCGNMCLCNCLPKHFLSKYHMGLNWMPPWHAHDGLQGKGAIASVHKHFLLLTFFSKSEITPSLVASVNRLWGDWFNQCSRV